MSLFRGDQAWPWLFLLSWLSPGVDPGLEWDFSHATLLTLLLNTSLSSCLLFRMGLGLTFPWEGRKGEELIMNPQAANSVGFS